VSEKPNFEAAKQRNACISFVGMLQNRTNGPNIFGFFRTDGAARAIVLARMAES
jgi:hypothetical protein